MTEEEQKQKEQEQKIKEFEYGFQNGGINKLRNVYNFLRNMGSNSAEAQDLKRKENK